MSRTAAHIKHLRVIAAAIAIAIIAIAAPAAYGQTDAQFSQYFEVPNMYNPSAIGTTDFVKIRAGGKMEWIGIDHAPVTFTLMADMPLKLFNKRFGVGLLATTETIGLYSSLQVGADLAYKIKKWNGEFSFGVQLGIYDQKFSGSQIFIPEEDDYHQTTDEGIPQRDVHGTAFDMSAGIWYMHKSQRFWGGLSCTHITSPTITMKSEGSESTTADQNYEFQANRTLYFMGGCNIPIKNTLFELLPSILVKSDFTFTTGEVDLRARYNKMFSLGVGYRYKTAIIATLGVEIKNFYIGYAFDYSTSAIAKTTAGSHEVFLGYSLKLDLSDKNKNKHKSIRIM